MSLLRFLAYFFTLSLLLGVMFVGIYVAGSP